MSKRYRITQGQYRDYLKEQPSNTVSVSNEAEVEVINNEGAWVQAYVWVPRDDVLAHRLGAGRRLPSKVLDERKKELTP